MKSTILKSSVFLLAWLGASGLAMAYSPGTLLANAPSAAAAADATVMPGELRSALHKTLANEVGSASGHPLTEPREWAEQKVFASDGTQMSWYGFRVAMSGSHAVIAAPATDVDGVQNQGAVYAFTESNGTWTQTAKLTASEPRPSGLFGYSIAFSGDTLLVGSPGATLDGGATFSGAIYIFKLTDGIWAETERLSPAGAVNEGFGQSVAFTDTTILVGAPGASVYGFVMHGAAYVFTKVGGAWTETQKLAHSDGGMQNLFGDSVAISGGTALISAPHVTVDGRASQGAVYVFKEFDGVWTEAQRLTANDAQAGDILFGGSLALDNDTALIGVPGAVVKGRISQGSAYIFTESHGSWSQGQKLKGSDGELCEAFGQSVALSGTRAIVGTIQSPTSTGVNAGAAYVFERTNGSWSETDKISASDGDTRTFRFGWGVAFDRHTVLVSAMYAGIEDNPQQGAAYFYSMVLNPPAATLTPTALAFNVAADATQSQDLTVANAANSEVLTFDIAAYATFGERHVIVRSGAATAASCTGPIVTWLSAAPASGSVIDGTEVGVRITADPAAGSLVAGHYAAELCVSTNDPDQAVVAVPVSLTVTPAILDRIFCSSFEGKEDAVCGLRAAHAN